MSNKQQSAKMQQQQQQQQQQQEQEQQQQQQQQHQHSTGVYYDPSIKNFSKVSHKILNFLMKQNGLRICRVEHHEAKWFNHSLSVYLSLSLSIGLSL